MRSLRNVLRIAGPRLEQSDVVELNEALAAKARAVTRTLGTGDDAPSFFMDSRIAWFFRNWHIGAYLLRGVSPFAMKARIASRTGPQHQRHSKMCHT
ncbi:MAG: hypothetical protein EPN57_06000 [Paraburkholderia sp.]|nr:MAG: hypothetical protein EPN57_06000 [Paraburkholderia sp.]